MITYTLSNPNELSNYWDGRWKPIIGSPAEIALVLKQMEEQDREPFVCVFHQNERTTILYVPRPDK